MGKADDQTHKWDHREKVAAGPGDNRSRAKARKAAKRYGNKVKRRKGRQQDEYNDTAP